MLNFCSFTKFSSEISVQSDFLIFTDFAEKYFFMVCEEVMAKIIRVKVRRNLGSRPRENFQQNIQPLHPKNSLRSCFLMKFQSRKINKSQESFFVNEKNQKIINFVTWLAERKFSKSLQFHRKLLNLNKWNFFIKKSSRSFKMFFYRKEFSFLTTGDLIEISEKNPR